MPVKNRGGNTEMRGCLDSQRWIDHFIHNWADIEESLAGYSKEQKEEIEEYFNELL